MGKPEYVSLHNHLDKGSMLDGFGKTADYLDRAVELGMTGFGSSDHGSLAIVYDLIQQARKRDLTPVPGIEMYMAPVNPEGAQVKTPVFYGNHSQRGEDVSSRGAYLHLTMWATNSAGLHNLFRLSTLSYRPENTYKKNRIDFDMLAEYNEGLVVSTGCPSGEISTRFRLGQDKEAYEYAGRLKEVFGDGRLFVEVMDHNMSIDLERKLTPKHLELAKKLDLPLLATNDCHYVMPQDAISHEEMLCVQSNSKMSEPSYDNGGSRFAFNGHEYYLKSAEEMARIFPEDTFPGALTSSLVIAERASDIKMPFNDKLKPVAFLPEEFGNDEVAYFRHLAEEGYQQRYGNADPELQAEARRRMAYEDQVIVSSDFANYFIVVREYLQWAKDNYSTMDENGELLVSSIGPGRGSVGGSIMAYLLGISELCPIRHDLIFERFLSAGRGATYRITYDDGTFEDVIASDERPVELDGQLVNRYIHQLSIGDAVAVTEDATPAETS